MIEQAPKRGKRPRDANQLAKRIVDLATTEEVTSEKSATTRGRKGGLKGGRARADKLTPSQRAEIAKTAAEARWKAKRDD